MAPGALTATPAASNAGCACSVSGRWRPAACRRAIHRAWWSKHELPSIWATWLACVCSSTSMPSARKAAVTASPMAGSHGRTRYCAQGRDLLPSWAKACASSSATTDEPITARRSNGVARQGLGGSPVGDSSARNRRDRRAGTRGDQAAVEHHDALATLVQTNDKALVVLKRASPCRTVSRMTIRMPSYHWHAEFFDRALLGQQPLGQDRRRCDGSRRRIAFPAQMGDGGR